jgi:cell division protein FtsI (penicillin-binding protein 3)
MTAIPASQRVKLPTQQQKSLALTYHRLMLMMLVFAGVTFLIVMRLVMLQISTDRSVVAAGDPLLPARGDLVDRNGAPLARTIDAWSIYVHPNKLIGDPEELAVKLSELMPERSAAEYLKILKSGKGFVYLNRRALPELVSAVNALASRRSNSPASRSGFIRRRSSPRTCSAGPTSTAAG